MCTIPRSRSFVQYRCLKSLCCVVQNTIANMKAFIPTLEAAFSAAGIPERDSWVITSTTILAVLEAEIETLRRENLPAVQQQLPATEQHPSQIGTGKVAFPDDEQYKSSDIGGFELVLIDAAKTANEASKVGKGREGAGKTLILNEPQEADDGDDDEEDVSVAQDGKKDPKDILTGLQSTTAIQSSKDWTGSVL